MSFLTRVNNSRPYQVCTRCVMDTSDMDIVFDAIGVCNHCRWLSERLSHRGYQNGVSEKTWEDYIKVIKRKNRSNSYDCVVGVSGGVDSSYAAYLCKVNNLRALLVHVDNGWNTDIAVANIKSLVEKLGFDYISYVIDWSEFREVQLAFLKSSSVDLEMTTDIAISAAVYKVASDNNIKYIISGGNLASEGILPVSWGYHTHKDLRMYRYIVKNFSSIRLKSTPVLGLFKESYYRFFKGIKHLYILNYIDYNKELAKKFLIESLGWRNYGGKHHESTITAFWQGYVMVEKYGMDYRRATLSSEICNGFTTREEALRSLSSAPYDQQWVNDTSGYVSKKLGITIEELQCHLAQPPKTYRDFPNNKEFIEFCYRMYSKYFNKNRV